MTYKKNISKIFQVRYVVHELRDVGTPNQTAILFCYTAYLSLVPKLWQEVCVQGGAGLQQEVVEEQGLKYGDAQLGQALKLTL
jgi:hypothetical protein